MFTSGTTPHPSTPLSSLSPSEDFPRQARLTQARQFETILRRPELRLRAGPLRLNAVFNRMQRARLGLIVGKKAIPRAHKRNRIKRILRDRFRRRRDQLGALDIVIRVAGPVKPSDLDGYLDRLFAEIIEKCQAERL